MSMKLTKKDKLMLGILGVIIVVAVFFVYVIMPLQAQSKELDPKITEARKKLDGIKNEYTQALRGGYASKLDDELEKYYAGDLTPSQLHENLDKIGVEQMMYEIFNDENMKLNDWASQGWQQNQVVEYVTVDIVTVQVLRHTIASIGTSFTVEKKEQFFNLLDRFYADPDFQVISFSVTDTTVPESNGSEEEGTPGGGGGGTADAEKQAEFTGNIQLEFYMGDGYTPTAIPAPLPDVQVAVGSATNVITFPAVSGAVSYELYTVTADETTGVLTYDKIKNASIKAKEGEASYTYTIPANVLGKGQTKKIAVRAIGDNTSFFKTLLNKTPGTNTIVEVKGV